MKAEEKEQHEVLSASRPPRPRGWWLFHPFLAFQALYHAANIFWSVLIFLLVLFVYLWAFGLPPPVIRYVLKQVNTGSFYLTAGQLRLDGVQGVALDRVQLFHPTLQDESLCQIKKISLRLDWKALIQRKSSLRAVYVNDAYCCLFPIAISNVNAVALMDGNAIRIPQLSMTWCGFPLEGEGTVQRPEKETSPGFWIRLEKTLKKYSRSPDGYRELCSTFERVTFGKPPLSRVRFHIKPDEPMKTMGNLFFDGSDLRIRGGHFDQCRLELEYREQKIHLGDLSLRSGAQGLYASGSFSTGDKKIEGHLFNDLPADLSVQLLPEKWRRRLSREGSFVEGSFKTELWVDPAGLKDMVRSCSGWVSVEKAQWRNVWLEKAFATFKSDKEQLSVKDILALVGRDRGQGPFAGSYSYKHRTRDFNGTVKVGFDPHEMLPVLTSNQVKIVQRFEFTNAAPVYDGIFSGKKGDPTQFCTSGFLTGSNFSYRSVAVNFFQSGLVYSNSTLIFDDCLMAREEGAVEGKLSLNFKKKVYEVDATSTVQPQALMKIIGPRFEEHLQFAKFQGAGKGVAKGRVDILSPERTDLVVDMEAQQVQLKSIPLDSVSFQLAMKGRHFYFENILGRSMGGEVQGFVYLNAETSSLPMRYETSLSIDGMSFATIIQTLKPENTNGVYQGVVSGDISLAGVAQKDMNRTIEGVGHIALREGQLFKIPLLGGLSKYLSMIYPGLGFLSQNDFHADFVVQNGVLHTDNAVLEGSVLSVKARGDYELDGRLKFYVEVQPLRKGVIAAVLRLVTMPVTKLLEFTLSGTVKDPKWRPSNLPKEMFLIFD